MLIFVRKAKIDCEAKGRRLPSRKSFVGRNIKINFEGRKSTFEQATSWFLDELPKLILTNVAFWTRPMLIVCSFFFFSMCCWPVSMFCWFVLLFSLMCLLVFVDYLIGFFVVFFVDCPLIVSLICLLNLFLVVCLFVLVVSLFLFFVDLCFNACWCLRFVHHSFFVVVFYDGLSCVDLFTVFLLIVFDCVVTVVDGWSLFFLFLWTCFYCCCFLVDYIFVFWGVFVDSFVVFFVECFLGSSWCSLIVSLFFVDFCWLSSRLYQVKSGLLDAGKLY